MIDLTEGWVSPAEIFTNEIITKFSEAADDNIQVLIETELGAKIDRDEFIKAMNYDREQYKKGFENGYKKRDEEIVRCKDCKYYIGKFYCNETDADICDEPNAFCSHGKRKDGD